MNTKVWDLYVSGDVDLSMVPWKGKVVKVTQGELENLESSLPTYFRYYDEIVMEQGYDGLYVPKPGWIRYLKVRDFRKKFLTLSEKYNKAINNKIN